jgi:hypothetical protein
MTDTGSITKERYCQGSDSSKASAYPSNAHSSKASMVNCTLRRSVPIPLLLACASCPKPLDYAAQLLDCGTAAACETHSNNKCNRLSLQTTLFYKQNQLHVSTNDDSHRQADHKNIQTKCLRLHRWLEVSNLTNVVLYT